MGKKIEQFQVELTDLFQGEANYSWVRRVTLEVPQGTSDTALVRKAKKELGLSGMRTKNSDFGDTLARDFSASGFLAVMFISYDERGEA